MKLLLLRHGQTQSNVIGALDTAVPGSPLNELGLRQAAAVPEAFASESIDALFASTILRAQQTAHPLASARGLELDILEGLREITAGSLEMLSDHKSQGIYTATAFAWAKGDLYLRMPGGENGHEFFERYDAAMKLVRESGSTVVAVSHGAAMRTWVAARCENIDGEFAGTHTLDNTGLATLESRPHGAWRLLDWQAAPVGGPQFAAENAPQRAIDPTGEARE